MGSWPEWQDLEPIITLSPYGANALAGRGVILDSAPTGGVWPSADRALFYQFRLEKPAVVSNVYWTNAATVAGAVDAGIYTMDGRLLLSTGSQAQTATNTNQVVAVTSTMIGPGTFMMALTADTVGATFARGLPPANYSYLTADIMQCNSIFPLSLTAVFSAFSVVGGTYIPCYGFSTRTPI